MKTSMKRVFCIIFAMCIALFALTACGGGEDNTDVSSQAPTGNNGDDSEVIATKPSGIEGTEWENFDPYATAAGLKGTTVRFATWIDHTETEGAVPLANFEADTGLKVSLFTVPQSGYVNTLMTKMASGDIPDVFVNNERDGNFPMTIQIAAPINKVSTLNLDEPIWHKSMNESGTIDGNVYLVNTIGTPWSGSNLVFYNKLIFEENGFKTPADYYA